MAVLKFYRGLEARYDSVTHKDGIYFCTDTYKIMLNGQQYGGADTGKTVKDAELEGMNLKLTYTDESTKNVDLSKLIKYTSAIESKDLQMPETVGGIKAGTTVKTLEAKNYNQMFDELLFPTVNPTYVAPSASIAFKNYAKLQKVGSTGPTEDNFTTGYNPGAINVNGVKQADRGGTLKEGESFIYVNGDAGNKTLPTTLALGNTTFKYRASYEAGPQPKDNKGNDYGTPLAAGTVDSSAITVNGTHPWFASTATAGTLTEQSLISWNNSAGQMTTPRFTLQPHTATAPQTMKFPRKLTQLQMLNTVSQQMEVVSFSDWAESSASESTNSVETTYYTYTYSGSDRGSVTLIATF